MVQRRGKGRGVGRHCRSRPGTRRFARPCLGGETGLPTAGAVRLHVEAIDLRFLDGSQHGQGLLPQGSRGPEPRFWRGSGLARVGCSRRDRDPRERKHRSRDDRSWRRMGNQVPAHESRRRQSGSDRGAGAAHRKRWQRRRRHRTSSALRDVPRRRDASTGVRRRDGAVESDHWGSRSDSSVQFHQLPRGT